MNSILKNKITASYFVIIFIFLGYLILRSPQILLEGRYFAEEGSVWWSYSLSNNFLDTLLYTPAAGGYVCIVCNLQILVTKYLPIGIGPLFTVWTSILFSIMPSILFFKLNKRSNQFNKLLMSILLLILPSMNFLEVFANSISTSQFFAISTFIILNYGLNEKKLLILEYVIIFIGFLSYYYSIFLIPCFLLKYFFTKNKNLIVPIVLGIFSSLVHLNVIIYLLLKESFFARNFDTLSSPLVLLNNIKLSIAVNFFGEKFYKDTLLNTISLIIIIFLVFLMIKGLFQNNILIIISAVLLQLMLLYFGQVGNNYYGRYAVVASTLVMFIIFEFFMDRKEFAVVFLFFLFVSIYNFNTQGGSYFIECNQYCIGWNDQIKNIQNGIQDKYIHWPMGEGDPYWFTNAIEPKPNITATHQFYQETSPEKTLELYDLNYFEILTYNIKNIFKLPSG